MSTEANLWSDLLALISPEKVYQQGWEAAVIASIFAVMCFALAPGLRFISESISSMRTGKPMDSRAMLTDIVLAAIGYSVYALIGWVLYEFVIQIHGAVNSFGYTGVITDAFAGLMKSLDANDADFQWSDVPNSIVAALTFGFFMLTNL